MPLLPLRNGDLESQRARPTLGAALVAAILSFPRLSHGAEPVLDNERVTVWDTTMALPAAQHEFVAVPLEQPGTAVFGHRGEVPSEDGVRTIVIELKDSSLAPIANNSGYPLAFPRPYAVKLFENARVVAWNVTWPPGEPTPMHFHDKDALAVFESAGSLQSATPDGKTTVGANHFADIVFAPRNRTHSELLSSGHERAVIIELK